ncbi:hypothetical protein MNBD_NITROSPINAE02-986 [hydrothermal vent metagenome]|uniref:ATP synthase F0 sector subunit b n=1 Tax=hydrothermal vent metagenome TaxID=652676 RepID=A0A3B1CH70_9ZZZZ
MARLSALAVFAVTLALAGNAFAGGLEMASEWTWYRDGSRIFNAVIVLGGFVWLGVKFGGPMLRKRAELIAEKFKTLEANQAKAEASLKEYEKKISDLKSEADKIRQEAKDEGEMIKQRILSGAEKAAEQIMAKAAERIAVETEQAKEKLKREATIAAVDLAEEIIKRNMSAKDQENILSEYIENLGNSKN